MLEDVCGLVKAQGMDIVLNGDVISIISDIGFDPEFGARSMERVIQNIVEDQLSIELLKGKFSKWDTIYTSVKGGSIIFKKKD